MHSSRCLAEWDEGDDVDRSDPGVLAGVLVHVDLADRPGDEPLEPLAHRIRLAGDREDAPVVARVARPVEEVHARHRGDVLAQPLDDVEAAALADVGNGLDERHAAVS